MVAYIISKTIAFVPNPDCKGHWIRTHPAVAIVACPTCGMQRGWPCAGNSNRVCCNGIWLSDAHWERRRLAKASVLSIPALEIRIDTEPRPESEEETGTER